MRRRRLRGFGAQTGDPSLELPAGYDDRKVLILICRCFPDGLDNFKDEDGQLTSTLTALKAIDHIAVAVAVAVTAEANTGYTIVTDH